MWSKYYLKLCSSQPRMESCDMANFPFGIGGLVQLEMSGSSWRGRSASSHRITLVQSSKNGPHFKEVAKAINLLDEKIPPSIVQDRLSSEGGSNQHCRYHSFFLTILNRIDSHCCITSGFIFSKPRFKKLK